MCRAEFRLLKEVYPRYADRVDLLAVAVDPTERPEALRAFQRREGYGWEFAVADPDVLERYDVRTTMRKFGIDRSGNIAVRGGHAADDEAAWGELFETLARS